MCMYTRVNIPYIAERDIHCIKYLKKDFDGYVTPCRDTPVKIGSTMIPDRYDSEICVAYGDDNFGNRIYEINGGVIHAKLTEGGFENCKAFDAVIPKGTKYYVDPFGNNICAEKLKITKKGYTKPDTSFAEEILSHAPEVNGIRIGDYITTTGEFVKPSKKLKKSDIIARVVGFHDNEPLLAALEYERECWSTDYVKVNKSFGSLDAALKDFSGKSSTENYLKKRNNICKAYEHCVNYKSDVAEFYFPAFGEVTTMLNNAIYINAAVAISGIGFIIDTTDCYWSCSEGDERGSWYCRLGGGRVGCGWDGKCCSHRVVPFLAKMKN